MFFLCLSCGALSRGTIPVPVLCQEITCRSNVTAPVSWSIISCSDSTCFFPSGIQTVGNYFSMCKSLVAWILGRNWGRLKRRKVRLWITCRKLNNISVWILKRSLFFFWYEVLYPWCALWCLNKFDMLSFQGLSFLHTWLFQLISLFPIWKMPNSSEDVILSIPAVLIFCISLARENDFTGHDMSRSAYLMAA